MKQLQKLSVLSWRTWRLGGSIAPSADGSLIPAETTLPIVQRQTYGSDPLQQRHFSGFSRASRRIKLSIQRLLPHFPPVISAENMQILQKLQLV